MKARSSMMVGLALVMLIVAVRVTVSPERVGRYLRETADHWRLVADERTDFTDMDDDEYHMRRDRNLPKQRVSWMTRASLDLYRTVYDRLSGKHEDEWETENEQIPGN